MPPKGPEKQLFALRVTLPTWKWLEAKAAKQGLSVPTYLAKQLEEQADGHRANSL